MKKILLIYTGGTIGMIKDPLSGALRPFRFDQIAQKLPELRLLDCYVETISFEKLIDSSDITLSHWKKIGQIIWEHYATFDGFVVLHGSDTMSYTASALSFMLENLQKPVIFTGSQLPIGDLRTDARENLITSIHLASLWKNNAPLIQEVCLYFEYKLYRGNRTIKVDANNFQAFASPNYLPLAESGVSLKLQEHLLLKQQPQGAFSVFSNLEENVAVLKVFPGISPAILSGFFKIEKLKGVVMETFGTGNALSQAWFLSELKKATERGVVIVNVTQCLSGAVLPGKYETGAHFESMGIINGKDLTTEAALAKLMYLLGKNTNCNILRINMEQPLRGEMQ